MHLLSKCSIYYFFSFLVDEFEGTFGGDHTNHINDIYSARASTSGVSLQYDDVNVICNSIVQAGIGHPDDMQNTTHLEEVANHHVAENELPRTPCSTQLHPETSIQSEESELIAAAGAVQHTTHLEDVGNQHTEPDEMPEVPRVLNDRQPCVEASDRNDESGLIERARAVGIAYEFAKPGSTETDDDKRRRRRRNQRRILQGERRLLEVINDLPPPPPPGSSQHEDECYAAIRAFEVEQMTYEISCCNVCRERRLQAKPTRGDCCSRCKRDKQTPKLWSEENNMDPGLVPDELADLTDAEQMLIARLAPAIHVRMMKHGGIGSRGHCVAFPQAVQEPTTILPRLPAEVDIIRVRRQGKDDTHKDFRVRRHRVEAAIRWLKHNNPAYSTITIDEARIQDLPEDGELPQLRTVEFTETQREDDQGPAPNQLDLEVAENDEETVSGVLLPEPGVNVQEQIETAVNQLSESVHNEELNNRHS